MADLASLILYCVQQLGIMLGVGAETIILVATLLSMRDGAIDSQEERFAQAVRRVLLFGLACIVISGVAITAMELFAGHQDVVFSPAYLFKWALILGVLLFSLVGVGKSLPAWLLEGVIGGTWYALFVIHILAPVAIWIQLIELYVVWLLGFCLCWSALVFMLRGGKGFMPRPKLATASYKANPFPAPAAATPKQQPKLQQVQASVEEKPKIVINPNFIPTTPSKPVLPPAPKPPSAPVKIFVQPQPSGVTLASQLPPLKEGTFRKEATPPPQTPAVPQPAPAPVVSQPSATLAHILANLTAGLPAVRVMPKSPQDIEKAARGPVVELKQA